MRRFREPSKGYVGDQQEDRFRDPDSHLLDRGVDTDRKEARVLHDDRSAEVVEPELRPAAVLDLM